MGYSVFIKLSDEECSKVKEFFETNKDIKEFLENKSGIQDGPVYSTEDLGYAGKQQGAVFGINYGGSDISCYWLSHCVVSWVAGKLGKKSYLLDGDEKMPVFKPWWENTKDKKKWDKWRKIDYKLNIKYTYRPISNFLSLLESRWKD